jgi:hypothetical protein
MHPICAGQAEGGSQRSDVRGQRPEGRGQKSEVRDQRSDVRSQKSEGRAVGKNQISKIKKQKNMLKTVDG